MKAIVKAAYYSFWASKKERARIQSLELQEFKQEIERSGGEVTDIIPIENSYGNIKFWFFKIKEK